MLRTPLRLRFILMALGALLSLALPAGIPAPAAACPVDPVVRQVEPLLRRYRADLERCSPEQGERLLPAYEYLLHGAARARFLRGARLLLAESYLSGGKPWETARLQPWYGCGDPLQEVDPSVSRSRSLRLAAAFERSHDCPRAFICYCMGLQAAWSMSAPIPDCSMLPPALGAARCGLHCLRPLLGVAWLSR